MKISNAVLLCPILLSLMACSKPPILNGIRCEPSDDCGAASRRFDRVVRDRFPVGSSQGALEKELLAEGFERPYPDSTTTRCTSEQEISSATVGKIVVVCPSWDAHWNPQHALVYRSSNVSPCGYEAGILWSSDEQENLTFIEGYYDARCT